MPATERDPELPLWKGLLVVAVIVVIGAAVALSGLPQLIALPIMAGVIAITAVWWLPWLRGSEKTD